MIVDMIKALPNSDYFQPSICRSFLEDYIKIVTTRKSIFFLVCLKEGMKMVRVGGVGLVKWKEIEAI